MCKCKLPEGTIIKLDGVHELDPCIYETIEAYANVTVFVRRCRNCGHIDIAWKRQDDTLELEEEEWE